MTVGSVQSAASTARSDRSRQIDPMLGLEPAKELGDPVDPERLVLEAQIMARRGLLDEAERLARSALERRGESPVPLFADPRFTLAEILASAGRTDEARTEANACLRRYQAKGIVPLTEKALALLAEIPV